MSRRRTLRPEERDLWKAVTRTTHALHPQPLVPSPDQPATFRPATPPEAAPAPIPRTATRLPSFRVGERATAGLPPGLTKSAPSPLSMDAKTHARLTRGKLAPEARLDLHGMTLAEAHPALTGFIFRAHAEGERLVLVITGKGGRRDGPAQNRGILRHQVPHWLRQGGLAPLILQVTEAHLRHGGSGALYVYLRRR